MSTAHTVPPKLAHALVLPIADTFHAIPPPLDFDVFQMKRGLANLRDLTGLL